MHFIRRNRLLLFTIASILGLYFLWSPAYLLLTVLGYYIMAISNEIALHRYFAHRSFKCGPIGHAFLWFVVFISGLSDPVGYARQHRYHHKHSDTQLDIHSVVNSPVRAWFKNTWVDFSNININDLTNNKFNMFMHKHYFTLYFVFLFTMLYINLFFAFYFLVLPSALAINTSSAINVFCHNYGYRNFNTSDNSTNNTIINVLTLGGALHNNHHANPASYITKVKPFELDLLGLFIKYILKK